VDDPLVVVEDCQDDDELEVWLDDVLELFDQDEVTEV